MRVFHDAILEEEYKYFVSDHVLCLYDGGCWSGIITETSHELGDYLVRFMHPKVDFNPASRYSYPEKDDECWIPEDSMLCPTGPLQYHHGVKPCYFYNWAQIKKMQKVYKKFQN